LAKLSIVGAGAVGSTIAYTAMLNSSVDEIVLFDLDFERAKAEVDDIGHAAMLAGSTRINSAQTLSDTAQSDVVVITAGAKRKPGQTRLELLAINDSIVLGMIPEILEHSPQAKIVIVSNPCDVLATRAVIQHNLPASQVFSSGNVLDSSRLSWILAQKLKVSVQSVSAWVLGEHGDSQFPLWSQARVGGIPLLDFIGDGQIKQGELEEIAEKARTAGASVIAGKGATNYGIGASTIAIVEAIVKDQNRVLPVARLLDDYLGVSGVALSVPTIVNAHGAVKSLEVPMSDEEYHSFKASSEAIRSSVESLG